jgi:hypothetical protein
MSLVLLSHMGIGNISRITETYRSREYLLYYWVMGVGNISCITESYGNREYIKDY